MNTSTGGESLARLQETLLEKTSPPLLTLRLTIRNPYIGGYNSRPYSLLLEKLEPPRPTQFKGLWRWWARATLSNLFHGQKNYTELDKILEKYLGSTNKKHGQGRYRLTIEVSSDYNIETFDKPKELRRCLLEIMEEAHRYIRNVKKDYNCTIQFDPEEIRNNVDNGVNYVKIRSIRGRRHRTVSRNVIADINQHIEEWLKNESRCGKENLEQFRTFINAYIEMKKIGRLRLLFQPRSEEGETNRITTNVHFNSVKRGLEKYFSRLVENLYMSSLEKSVWDLEIKVFERESAGNIKDAVLIGSFILGLLLDGVGKLKNRGFGSIILDKVILRNDIKTIFENEWDNISHYGTKKCRFDEMIDSRVKLNHDMFAPCIKMFIAVIHTLAMKAFSSEKLSKNTDATIEIPRTMLPIVPTIGEPSEAGFFKVYVVPRRDTRSISNLKAISQASLKNSWKEEMIRRNPSINNHTREIPGVLFHTWVLGLPRAASAGRIRTGYRVIVNNRENDGEDGRRQSSFIFKDYGTFIVVSQFVSKDWPGTTPGRRESLGYYGRHFRRPVKIIKVENNGFTIFKYIATPEGVKIFTKNGNFISSNMRSLNWLKNDENVRRNLIHIENIDAFILETYKAAEEFITSILHH